RRAAAAVLVQVFVPGVRLLAAGPGAAPVLVQRTDGRLPVLRWPWRGRILRPDAGGGPSGAVAGGRCGARLGPAQRLLLPADQLTGQALPLRRGHTMAGPARGGARSRAVRQRRGGDR